MHCKNFIWTTLKVIFSLFRFFASSDYRYSNSCISAKFCPFITNHTSVESLCLSLALTDAVGLRVAFARHAVSPQALVSEAAGQSVLHPVVRRSGDHQQDVAHDGTEQAPSHKAVHPDRHITVSYTQRDAQHAQYIQYRSRTCLSS